MPKKVRRLIIIDKPKTFVPSSQRSIETIIKSDGFKTPVY